MRVCLSSKVRFKFYQLTQFPQTMHNLAELILGAISNVLSGGNVYCRREILQFEVFLC
jgi:hypothetical protein